MISSDHTPNLPSNQRLISIDALQPGMYIVAIQTQNGPINIRKSGLVKSHDMVKGLTEMGVQTLIIDVDNSMDLAPEYQVSNAMSDQFNRSLFLPTLQALPSPFSAIRKQILHYTSVIVIGLCIGYSIAYTLSFMPQRPAVPVVADTTIVNNDEVDIVSNEDIIAMPLVPEKIEEPPAAIITETIQSTTEVTQAPAVDIQAPISESLSEQDISPEVAAKVNQAVAALGGIEQLSSLDSTPSEPTTTVSIVDNIMGVAELPERILLQLPAMIFTAHMYSSNDADRWVRVNNRRLSEGGRIDNNLRIVTIAPQHVILAFGDTQFKMAALTDW